MFRNIAKITRTLHQNLVKGASYAANSLQSRTNTLACLPALQTVNISAVDASYKPSRTNHFSPKVLFDSIPTVKMASQRRLDADKRDDNSSSSSSSSSSPEQDDKNKPDRDKDDNLDEVEKELDQASRQFQKDHLKIMQNLEAVRLAAAEVQERKLNPEDVQDRLVIYEMDDADRRAARKQFVFHLSVATLACPASLALVLTHIDSFLGRLALGGIILNISFQTFIRAISSAAAVTSIEMVWATPSASHQASAEEAAKHAAEEKVSEAASKTRTADESHMTEHQLRKAHYAQIAEEVKRDEDAAKKALEGEVDKSETTSGVVASADGAPSMRDALAQKQRKEQEEKSEATTKSTADSTSDATADNSESKVEEPAQEKETETEKETAKEESPVEDEEGGLPDHLIIRRVARSLNNGAVSVLDLNQVVFASSYPQRMGDEDLTQADLDRGRQGPINGFALLLSMRGIPIHCYFKYVVHDEAFLQLLKAAKYNFRYLVERGNALYREREGQK